MDIKQRGNPLAVYLETVLENVISAELSARLRHFIQELEHDLLLKDLSWFRKVDFVVETQTLRFLRVPNILANHDVELCIYLQVSEDKVFCVSDVLAIEDEVNVTLREVS